MSASTARQGGGKQFHNRSNQRHQQQHQHSRFDNNGTAKPAKSPSVLQKSVQKPKQHRPLLIPVQPLWHAADLLDELVVADSFATADELSAEAKAELLKAGLEELETETEAYLSQAGKSSSQRQFFTEIATAGTLSDRISALTLVIQECPLHSTRSLNGLMALAKKKNRTAALQAVESLRDLFGAGNVLPDRKLVWFTNRDNAALAMLYAAVVKHAPLDAKAVKLAKQWTLLWAFEDWLKQLYFSFVQLLEQLSHDAIVHVRTSVLGDLVDLIRDKPEQEVNLLRLSVNKLGDADRRVASRASHLLLTLEQAHPAMKRVIVNAISELVFRPGADYHARYYSMITLNQTIVTNKDKDLANVLIEIYFHVFERLMAETKAAKENKVEDKKVKKKGRWKSDKKAAVLQEQQKKHKAKPSTTQQAVKQSPEALEEANMRLVSAILTGLNRAFPYSSLDEAVFKSHLNVIYDVARSGNFNARVQALMLLFQITSANQVQSDRFYNTLYESLLDPRVIVSSKQALFLNLVFKAMKADIKPERVKAYAKRLVQVAAETLNIGFCAGVIYLLSEIESAMPYLRTLITDPPDLGDDAEEVFKDVRDEDDEESDHEEQKLVKAEPTVLTYNGKTHDPLHSNASASCLWELLPLTRHFHPTVNHFATHYLAGTAPGARPDLALHTLTHFLDRFVYKAPKTKASTAPSGGAGSIMQPLAGNAGYVSKNVLVLKTKSARRGIESVNAVDWAAEAEKAKRSQLGVGLDEQFFAKYFVSKGVKPKKDAEEEQEEENVDSDGDIADEIDDEEGQELDEDEVWKAMMRSDKEIGDLAGDDEDEDLEFEDYEEDENEEAEDENEDAEEDGVESDFEDDEIDDDDDSEEDRALAAAFASSDDDDDDDDDEDSDEEDVIAGADDDDEMAALFAQENESLNTKVSKSKKRTAAADDDVDAEDEPKEKKKSGSREKRRKLKELPMFASAEDYQHLLGDD
ncbi:CBF/Mak21 family-domain-containing protein [Myxozyma melibiosi]|uniref:CBF/Mak21 family-domain-containing protein n=1 Tax=Myxozyma melibiosi TaxID=54550 RepID=A0ABR1F763_9ASCO